MKKSLRNVRKRFIQKKAGLKRWGNKDQMRQKPPGGQMQTEPTNDHIKCEHTE